MKIKKNDTVKVIAGKHKGSVGQIKEILHDKSRVIVSGAAMGTRHVRPSQENPQGGRVEFEQSIHLSNVQAVGSDQQLSRLGIKKLEDGKKVRFLVKTGEEYGEKY